MAYPKWQPGTLYQPGDIVIPITMPAPSSSVVTNGDFSAGAGGWDYSGGAAYVSDGHGWGGSGCVRLPGNVASGLALNQSIFVVPTGKQIIASCMIEQGASIVGATRGWVEVQWYAPDGTPLGAPDKGNEINDGRGGAWHKSTVTSTCPAGAAYCRAGIALWSVADHNHPIWGDALQVSGTFAGLPTGLAYRAVQTESGFSGGSEPAWPPILGQTVIDNEVTWEAISATRVIWTAVPLYVSGAIEPDWPTGVGEYVLDGSVVFRAVSRRVEDENCPNTKIVAIASSKVFCADDDIVRYSATVNPLDWSSSDDAGYLPTGLQNYGANPVAAMGLYRSNLIPFNAEAFQLWQVDEDPASMALLDALPMGSTQHHAMAPVSNDLFFLASQGVRTVGIAASSTNFQAGDVGMPIDPLVQAAMAEGGAPLGLYFPAAGQYWLMFPDLPEPVQIAEIQPVVGTEVTATQTIPGAYQSAFLYPLAEGGVGTAGAFEQVNAGGTITVNKYDTQLRLADEPKAVTYSGSSFGSSALYLRGYDENGLALSADDSFGYCKRIAQGDYTGYFTPTGVSASWWYNEGGYSPEYGGLLWFADDFVYVGVRATSQANNLIYKFPLNPAGNPVRQVAIATSVGTTTNPRFWMTRSREGFLWTITQDSRFQKYSANLELLDDRPFPLTLSGLRGFGVDGDVICLVYGTGTPGSQFAKISDWSLFGERVAHDSMSGSVTTRVLFDDDSCYIQCRNWVGRIEYKPATPIFSRTTTAFVYTMTRIGQVGAWSRYEFPFVVEDWAIAGDALYLRSGDFVHRVDEAVLGDEVATWDGSNWTYAIVPFPGLIRWPWLDFGQAGVTKLLFGFDIVGTGAVSVAFGIDQSNAGLFTPGYLVPADTVPGMIIPMPLAAPSLAVELRYDGSERWQWNALQLYLQDGRPMS